MLNEKHQIKKHKGILDPIVFLFHDIVFKLLLNIRLIGATLRAPSVKNLPAMQETQVRFPAWEDPLEKEMAIHSSILAWRIPWTEEPGRLQSVGSKETRLGD